MTYRLGIDVDPARTTWAVIAGTPERAPDAGAIDSVVTIVLRDDVIMAREFVEKLGQPEPIIIGGTPYGVEALLAKLAFASSAVTDSRPSARWTGTAWPSVGLTSASASRPGTAALASSVSPYST